MVLNEEESEVTLFFILLKMCVTKTQLLLCQKETFIPLILEYFPDLNTRVHNDCGGITPLISAVKNNSINTVSKLQSDTYTVNYLFY